MSRVLVVDRRSSFGWGLRFNLEAEGYSARSGGDGEAATELLLAKKRDFDAVDSTLCFRARMDSAWFPS